MTDSDLREAYYQGRVRERGRLRDVIGGLIEMFQGRVPEMTLEECIDALYDARTRLDDREAIDKP
jgi:hypothetical protein